jgi:hypothetical protein
MTRGVLSSLGIAVVALAMPVVGRHEAVRPLSEREMKGVVGGFSNDKKCAEAHLGCGSACIDIPGCYPWHPNCDPASNPDYWSKQAAQSYYYFDENGDGQQQPLAYKMCRDKYLWDGRVVCYDSLNVICARWEYFAIDQRSSHSNSVYGDCLWATACEGFTGRCPPPG